MSAEPRTRKRQLRWWERALERTAASKPGSWFFVNVAPHIDRRLIPLSRGRLSTGLGQPVGLLHTVGAKSGQPRKNPLLHLIDADRVVLIASKGGAPTHPAWFRNVMANPEVRFTSRGGTRDYVAHEAEGEERERLWADACELYAGYAEYEKRAGERRIPVVVLESRR